MNVTVIQLIEFEKGLMYGVFELCRQCSISLKFLLALFNRFVLILYRVVKYEKISIKFRKMRVLVAIVFRCAIETIYCALLVLQKL